MRVRRDRETTGLPQLSSTCRRRAEAREDGGGGCAGGEQGRGRGAEQAGGGGGSGGAGVQRGRSYARDTGKTMVRCRHLCCGAVRRATDTRHAPLDAGLRRHARHEVLPAGQGRVRCVARRHFLTPRSCSLTRERAARRCMGIRPLLGPLPPRDAPKDEGEAAWGAKWDEWARTCGEAFPPGAIQPFREQVVTSATSHMTQAVCDTVGSSRCAHAGGRL